MAKRKAFDEGWRTKKVWCPALESPPEGDLVASRELSLPNWFREAPAVAAELYVQALFADVRGRYEKAMRWLGFVQGMLVAASVCSITQMKVINGPEVETDVPPAVAG